MARPRCFFVLRRFIGAASVPESDECGTFAARRIVALPSQGKDVSACREALCHDGNHKQFSCFSDSGELAVGQAGFSVVAAP